MQGQWIPPSSAQGIPPFFQGDCKGFARLLVPEGTPGLPYGLHGLPKGFKGIPSGFEEPPHKNLSILPEALMIQGASLRM